MYICSLSLLKLHIKPHTTLWSTSFPLMLWYVAFVSLTIEITHNKIHIFFKNLCRKYKNLRMTKSGHTSPSFSLSNRLLMIKTGLIYILTMTASCVIIVLSVIQIGRSFRTDVWSLAASSPIITSTRVSSTAKPSVLVASPDQRSPAGRNAAGGFLFSKLKLCSNFVPRNCRVCFCFPINYKITDDII